MTIQFSISCEIPASPQQVYEAWLDSDEHTQMTGGQASCDDQVSNQFTAWDEYISGTNLELEAGKLIVQTWRTVQFDPSEPDSTLEVKLEPSDTGTGTKLTLTHSNLPDDGAHYEQGWIDNYFDPMTEYFSRKP